MERIKMKCPYCGNDSFIEVDAPYQALLDTSIRDFSTYYGCTECGYIIRFCQSVVNDSLSREDEDNEKKQNIKNINKENKKISREIEIKKEELQKLLKEKENPNRTVARDKEIEVEIENAKQAIGQLEGKIYSNNLKIDKLIQ